MKGKFLYNSDGNGLTVSQVKKELGISLSGITRVDVPDNPIPFNGSNAIEGEYMVKRTAVPLPYSSTLEKK